MKIREDTNEQGTPISVHKCSDCAEEFTVCPPAGEDWGGCLAPECKSYDQSRDADGLFGGSTGRIVRLDDYKPHLKICGKAVDGNFVTEVHVVPVTLMEDWINGKKPISDIPPSIIRKVFQEWLERLQ